jgi:arabinose operon protein AraL
VTHRPDRLFRGYVFDLDGTVYLGDSLLPTAGETITRLRGLGCRTVFLSNNPTHPPEDYAAKLTRLGLPTDLPDILVSTQVMVRFLQERMPGARLLVLGEAPLVRALTDGGFEVVEEAARTDAVIASFDRTFAYPKLQAAFDAIRAGARFFATNGDRYCPVPGGGQPDAASVIAAVEACTGVACEAVVGKPSRHTSEAILAMLDLPPGECLITGDRLETDVRMGLDAGMAAAITLTGATTQAMVAESSIVPTYVIDRLADLLPG